MGITRFLVRKANVPNHRYDDYDAHLYTQWNVDEAWCQITGVRPAITIDMWRREEGWIEHLLRSSGEGNGEGRVGEWNGVLEVDFDDAVGPDLADVDALVLGHGEAVRVLQPLPIRGGAYREDRGLGEVKGDRTTS